jgi:hypothetical protein
VCPLDPARFQHGANFRKCRTLTGMKRLPLVLVLMALLAILALAVLVWMLLAPKKVSAARAEVARIAVQAARSDAVTVNG